MSPLTVLVFKTSVSLPSEVARLRPLLNQIAEGRWSIDLEDCDQVLRIETSTDAEEICGLMQSLGHECEELEDIVF